MKESIDATDEPVPDPIVGCGLILFMIGAIAVMVISISVYLLFKANIILLILLNGILAVITGIILIVLCLKTKNHGKYELTNDIWYS